VRAFVPTICLVLASCLASSAALAGSDVTYACVKKGRKVSIGVDPAACVGRGKVLLSWPNPDRLASLDAKLLAANDTIAKLTTRLDKLEKDAAATEAFVAPLRPLVHVETGALDGLAGPHVLFEGANLHVRSGGGSTDDGGTPSGLGNLVIGYDESPQAPQLPLPNRGGSHNLIVGPGHEYTSTGGLVAGVANAIAGSGATVAGGFLNQASGPRSAVAGGVGNTASADNTSVGGGAGHQAATPDAWAAGTYSSAN
jgi:hypothetical protein